VIASPSSANARRDRRFVEDDAHVAAAGAALQFR
jgi:hypothetical protein